MPILKFVNVKQERTNFDFSDESLLRIAGTFLAFRELLHSTDLSEAQAYAAKLYVNAFELMSVQLNELSSAFDALDELKAAPDSAEKKAQIAGLRIDIEDLLRDMTGSTNNLSKTITSAFPIAFVTENKYLFDNLQTDLKSLFETFEELQVLVLNLDSKKLDFQGFIKFEDRIYQLRDFFNIYHDAPEKLILSARGKITEASREGLRLGADFFGTMAKTELVQKTAQLFGFDPAKVDAAGTWLQKWNDKHEKPSISVLPKNRS